MTLSLLADGGPFSEATYREACQRAVDINDPEKVFLLLEQANDHVENLSPSFHGELANYAYLDHRFITREIIKRCSEEQIAAAPSFLLEQFAREPDYQMMRALVKKGISGGDNAARTLHMLTYQGRESQFAESLLRERMWVNTNDYYALHICIQNDAAEVCNLLLDGGIDFDAYQQWAKNYPLSGHEETVQALAEHWAELKMAQEQEAASHQTGGMTFG